MSLRAAAVSKGGGTGGSWGVVGDYFVGFVGGRRYFCRPPKAAENFEGFAHVCR